MKYWILLLQSTFCIAFGTRTVHHRTLYQRGTRGSLPRAVWQPRSSLSSSSLSTSSDGDEENQTPSLSSSSPPPLYTLEYSANFRRHIVRKHDRAVIQSFAWLDAAIQAFPAATLKPVTNSVHGDLLPVAGDGGIMSSLSSSHTNNDEDDIGTMGGGGGGYPRDDGLAARRESNEAAIRTYLSSTLGWFDGQVESFLQSCPHLLVWPLAIIRERIDFLLCPLPEENVVAEVNATVIDWPLQYYGHRRGAGMSVAQLSHALSLVPNLLFRDLETATVQGLATSTTTLARLYEQTPAVVLELARKQLDALYGASNFDCVAYSHLHWKGWEFHQIKVVLQAFPGCVMCSEEPGWELLERGTRIRDTLVLESLKFLQYRLQIGPSHLRAMLKAHPPLSGYHVHQLRRNCDALQQRLRLTSDEVRQLVLRMPNVLGFSVDGLQSRVTFWTETVGLSMEELKIALGSQPSLMHYGLASNLEPKLRFLEELSLSNSDIKRITLRCPGLWGRSLDYHLRPLCNSFCSRCGNMTLQEFGSILRREPRVSKLNWKQNLSAKMDCLAERLSLSPYGLKFLLLHEPRMLMRSLKSALEPSLDLLIEASTLAETREAVLNIPSLLIIPHDSLRTRLKQTRQKGSKKESLLSALNKTSRKRRARPVYLLSSDGETEKEFASVEEAAREAGVSKPYMYALLREGRLVGERRYAYGTGKQQYSARSAVHLLQSDGETIDRSFANVQEAAEHAGLSKSYMYVILREKRVVDGRQYVFSHVEITQPLKRNGPTTRTAQTALNVETEAMKAGPAEGSLTRDVARLATLDPPPQHRITIYVSARAFPPEDTLTGRRRAGGIALYVPSWSTQDWKMVVSHVWRGQRYRLLKNSSTLLLGYPYTRPSYPRCSLYACREALRAARAWVDEHFVVLGSTLNPVEIEIVTDSNV